MNKPQLGMINKLWLLLLIVIVGWKENSFSQSIRKIDFDKSWKFRLDSVGRWEKPSANDEDWRLLNLPHDWSIEGAFSNDHPATAGGGALPGGVGWYRKKFTLGENDKNKIITIEFDGIYCNSEVWINGHSLGRRANGYISFQYDLSNYLYYGDDKENLIVVKVDNSLQPNSRWYSGSGIYRHVWLNILEKIHVDQWGTFVRTNEVSRKKATLQVNTKINNADIKGGDIQLLTFIHDADGKVVAADSMPVKTLAGMRLAVEQSFELNDPKLWSVDQPYLYTVYSLIKRSGVLIDKYITTTGIRYFHFDKDKGFFLNDQHVKIRGVCNHHDLGALGAAVNTRAIERQLEMLKAMGCNGIRTAHNPPAPELLELCDRMGFIVMNEAFDMWKQKKSEYDYHLNWEDDHYRDLKDLILRDRNHPSVFIWSVGNEIQEQRGDSLGRLIARELAAITRLLDSTRVVVTANNEIEHSNHLIQSGAFDLIGYNYNHKYWEGFPDQWPGRSLIVTESVSALATRGYYDKIPVDSLRRWPVRWDIPFEDGNKDHTVSAYDHVSTPWGSTHEESLKILEKHDHVSGMYIWTGFDYLGEPTPYTWPARSSYFGIIDLAGFPKDVYYLYQSVWTKKPVLHISPHWNWNKGDTVDVVAYYNMADEVELYLNGKSLGKKTKEKDQLHVKWSIPYASGTVKAVSRKNNKVVLIREIKTASAPYKIILNADRKKINADGYDLSFITATVTDNKGAIVPFAKHKITYHVSGAGLLAGVDNGDPVSHESFKGNEHAVLNGKGLAIVQSNHQTGRITVTAKADGLVQSSIVLEAN